MEGRQGEIQAADVLERVSEQLRVLEEKQTASEELAASLRELNENLKKSVKREENPDVFTFRDFKTCIMKPFLCGVAGGAAAVFGKALAEKLLGRKPDS